MPTKTPTHGEYIDYLLGTYQGRGGEYYDQFLVRPVAPGSAVLDWGCGLGNLLERLEATVPDIRCHGVDANPECIRNLREKHSHWDLEFLPSPALHAPFPDGAFDRIFLLDVIEHTHHPGALLRECHRLLRVGGLLTLSTPDRWAFYKRPGGLASNLAYNLNRLAGREWVDPTHVTEYTAASLGRLLAASPFGARAFRPSPWHQVPWLRPPKRHYSYIVDLAK